VSLRSCRVAAFLLAVAAACVCSLPSACRKSEDAAGEASASAKRYPFHGVIRQSDNEGKDLTVEHDAVPGFMGAMTMLFPARGAPEVLSALRPGDEIRADLVVDEARYWLEGIRRVGRAPAVASSTPSGGAAAASPASPAGPAAIASGAVTPRPNRGTPIGDLVPDFELTDQTGHAVRLSKLRGEPVAVTFLYTRCPIATACPMTTAKFSRVDAMLKDKGWGKLLVLTVDPEHDTPAVLADYASKAGADPKRWKFLTGDPKAVADAASSFGILYYPDKSGQIIHQQGVAVVGPDGKLVTIYYGETWEAEHVLRDMEKARKG
jgi:protein SCO1/2